MCTVLLPPGDNPISVNKYINYINISLTARLVVIRVNNQIDALFLIYLLIYFPSVHVSSNLVHTRQSPTQSDIYQMMYCHNLILLMMSTGLLGTCREVK